MGTCQEVERHTVAPLAVAAAAAVVAWICLGLNFGKYIYFYFCVYQIEQC